MLNLYYNPGSIRNVALPVLYLYYNLPLLTQKSRFRMGNLPDCPPTCKPVSAQLPSVTQKSRFLLGEQPKSTHGN